VVDVDLCMAADRNVEEAVAHFAGHGAGATLTQRAGALLVTSAAGLVGAFHNAVLRVTPDADPRQVLDEARALGSAHDRDIIVWAATHRDEDLAKEAVAQGLVLQSTSPGMALPTPPPTPVLPADVELAEVTAHAGVDAFAAVHREVFRGSGRDTAAVEHFASPGALLAPNVAAVVARVDGAPVACAMVLHTGRTAGIYWVATTPAARNRGLGTLVTATVARQAFDQGARTVVLQATALGAPVYRKLGFTRFTDYQRFLLPAPARSSGLEVGHSSAARDVERQ